MEIPEKVRALQKCGVFVTADEDALRWLAEHTEAENYKETEVVFREGDTSTRVYVVAWGSLQVRLSEDSKLVSFAEAGSLFGEYAMFVQGNRMARVVAAETSVLLSFSAAHFREFLLRCPTVMMELFQTAVRRLERAERAQR